MNSTALVGTWTLESWEVVDSNGAVDHPFGRKPVGYIMYGPEGYMSVAFMSPGREPFGAADILGGTPDEKCAAIGTYISYCGRYGTGYDCAGWPPPGSASARITASPAVCSARTPGT